jgi:hypothetical protein
MTANPMNSLTKNNTPPTDDDLRPDTEMILEHLKLMFGRVPQEYPGGRVEIRCLFPDSNRVENHTFDAETGLGEAVELSERFNK